MILAMVECGEVPGPGGAPGPGLVARNPLNRISVTITATPMRLGVARGWVISLVRRQRYVEKAVDIGSQHVEFGLHPCAPGGHSAVGGHNAECLLVVPATLLEPTGQVVH